MTNLYTYNPYTISRPEARIDIAKNGETYLFAVDDPTPEQVTEMLKIFADQIPLPNRID